MCGGGKMQNAKCKMQNAKNRKSTCFSVLGVLVDTVCTASRCFHASMLPWAMGLYYLVMYEYLVQYIIIDSSDL